MTEVLVVTDCCGRLLPASQTLTGDVHYPDLCPACDYLDGREHDRHVTCTDGKCPGRDWVYVDGRIVGLCLCLIEDGVVVRTDDGCPLHSKRPGVDERPSADNGAPCQHPHVEGREKFDGTPYWVCLDCGEDWWEGPPRVTPPGQGNADE